MKPPEGPLTIGMAGPITVDALSRYLDPLPAGSGGPKGLGGAPVVNLIRGLLERGHHVVAFTLDPAVTGEVILTGPALRVCIGPYRPAGRARDGFAVERRYLESVMRREAPAVVHAHWTYEFALAALASGIPHVVTAHDAPLRVLRFDLSAYRAVRTVMAAAVARRALNLVAVSPYIADHYRRWLKYRRPIDVVPNSLPSELFRLGAQRLSMSAAKEHITYGAVLNGWNALKNGETLLRAFQLVRRDRPDTRLHLYGHEYGNGEAAEAWAGDHGLTGGVEFCGKLDPRQLWPQVAASVDIFVHPSREESFSMAVAEAMAVGIPVIAGASSGAVPWTIGDPACGLLTDVSSPPALAAAMLSLAADPDLRVRMGHAAHVSAGQRFDAAAVAQLYEQLYWRIQAERRPAPHADTPHHE